MTNRPLHRASVDAEVRSLLGDQTSEWMQTPNRLFDNLAPCDLMHSPEGAKVVLAEFHKFTATHAAQLRARRT
jgi:uncharacterized protein (DUF2384 family)